MLRSPGPDGALLRSLRRQYDALYAKQMGQMAVLSKVARRALEIDKMHREEIASYGRRRATACVCHHSQVHGMIVSKCVLAFTCVSTHSLILSPYIHLCLNAPMSVCARPPRSVSYIISIFTCSRIHVLTYTPACAVSCFVLIFTCVSVRTHMGLFTPLLAISSTRHVVFCMRKRAYLSAKYSE